MVRGMARLLGRLGMSRPVGGGGARGYVGGLWHELGELQFRFLVDHGLRPEHVCLDIACGSLRGGVRLIPYLEPGHYLGIDINAELIEHGRAVELGETLLAIKRPQFVVSGDFTFERFDRKPDVAIAQSLFTHLVERDIALCLTKLRAWCAPTTVLYATFFEAAKVTANPTASNPHGRFAYTRAEMEALAARTGWRLTYLGDWGHPRDQMMLRFDPAPATPA